MSERSSASAASEKLLSRDVLAQARRPLGEASTLPAEAFTSPAVYRLETERIFRREWLCAGRLDQIPEPGDYFALDLLGDCLVVVRGADHRVRVLSRVCRHRGAELLRGSGNAKSFRCPYHAWSYRLDGSLAGAPYMDDAAGFDREACRLPELRSEIWEGWIFVNFDREASPLGDRLAPLSQLLANYRMSEMISVETATFDSPFNWKVLVDNFMEAYHHIATHRDTLQGPFPAALSSTPDNQGPYSVLLMPPAESTGGAIGGLPAVGPVEPEEEGRLVAAVVFPFHLFAPTPESLTWYQLIPQSVDRFTLRIFNCFPKSTLEDPALGDAVTGMGEITKVVHRQDIGACEATWAGLNAVSFEAGHLSPLERSIWQFNQWWLDQMDELP